MTGQTCHRTRQDQLPTVRSTRNLPNREPSPMMAIRSPKRVKRVELEVSSKYQQTQVQVTTILHCLRVVLQSPCLEENQIHYKIRTAVCQAQGSTSQRHSIQCQVSSSSTQSDPSSASRRTSRSIQSVHRNTLQHTQVRPLRDKTSLVRRQRMQPIQRSSDHLVTREETVWEPSLRTRTSENTDRSVRRQRSTWECQGQVTTRSLAISISETQLDQMTGRARTPSSASA